MPTFRIFEGMSKSDMNRIIDSGMICPIEGGKLLFRKGEKGHEMYVIITGRINMVDEYEDKRAVIAELGPGEIFGEMAMFEEEHIRSTHAVVSEPSQVLVLSEDTLEQLLEKKMPKQFLVNIIRVLCHRLRVTNNMYMTSKYGGKWPQK